MAGGGGEACAVPSSVAARTRALAECFMSPLTALRAGGECRTESPYLSSYPA